MQIKTQLADTPELTKLVVDLSECGPDDAFSTVPYIKGSTFLRYLEDLLGGPSKFEPFFRAYLDRFKYQSVLTNDFKQMLYEWFREDPNNEVLLERINWDLWLFGEGMPPVIPRYVPEWESTSSPHTNGSSHLTPSLPQLRSFDAGGMPSTCYPVGRK